MENTNNSKSYNADSFWLAFALGTTLSATFVFLFGTTNGRKILKKLLEATEGLEQDLDLLLGDLTEELADKIKHKAEEPIDKVVAKLKTAETTGLHNLITKIKSFSENKKSIKTFFVKD